MISINFHARRLVAKVEDLSTAGSLVICDADDRNGFQEVAFYMPVDKAVKIARAINEAMAEPAAQLGVGIGRAA